jgi:hypothetical protein
MAGVAFAADLPVSGPYASPFIVRQPVEWTGLYFGANAATVGESTHRTSRLAALALPA